MLQLRTLMLLLALVLTACSGQTVRHLPTSQWKSASPETLHMRYLAFQYRVIPIDDSIAVVAEAYPVVSLLPDWASWYGEICLTVYVADEQGTVLAQQEQTLVPRPLNREAALPVEAVFDLGTDKEQPLYISFGYRLRLTDTAPGAPTARAAETEAVGDVPEDGITHRVLVTEGALEK